MKVEIAFAFYAGFIRAVSNRFLYELRGTYQATIEQLSDLFKRVHNSSHSYQPGTNIAATTELEILFSLRQNYKRSS